jgi:two-component system copper resistance phosphate regulon response regulator CusR
VKVEIMRILIVEDEPKTADYLHQGLSEGGYIVDKAVNGVDGLHLVSQHAYDLVVLDVNLPEIDGWGVLEQIRRNSSTRVIMLTARGRLMDKIKGLDLGADDYLVKPFEFPELLARIRTLLRRSEQAPVPDVLRVADLELDPARHRAFRGEQRIDLTTKEFALLHLLMRRSGEVLSRTQIISLVWDMNFDCDTNVVEVSIRRLRAKIDEPFDHKLIHTLRGVGYVLEKRA